MPGLSPRSRPGRFVTGTYSPRLGQLLAEAIGATRWIADATTLDMHFVERGIERLTGWDAQAWRTPGFLTDHLARGAQRDVEGLRAALTDGAAFDVTLRIERPRGGVVALRAIGHAVPSRAKPATLVGSFLPASRETADAPLAAAALAAYPGALALLDAAGVIIAANGTWEAIVAAEGAPLGQQTDLLSACRHAADRGDAAARETLDGLATLLAGRRPSIRIEDPWPTRGGVRHFVLLGERLASADGGAAIAYLDVSAQRHAELALHEAREELVDAARFVAAGELVGSLTHELRQPLTALTLNLESVSHVLATDPPRVRDAIGAVDAAVEEQRRLRHTLQVAHDVIARHTPRRQPVDFARLRAELLALVEGEALARRCALEFAVADGLPPVHADGTQLRLAILSLLLHRLARLPSARDLGAPAPSLAVSVAAAGGDAVDISVAERGAGTASLGGGVALARTVAELHSGWLATDAREDGSVVSIRLPLGTPLHGG